MYTGAEKLQCTMQTESGCRGFENKFKILETHSEQTANRPTANKQQNKPNIESGCPTKN
jgi:hypothetical protein